METEPKTEPGTIYGTTSDLVSRGMPSQSAIRAILCESNYFYDAGHRAVGHDLM